MVTAALFATPERKEVIDFTDPLYEMGMGYIVLKDNDEINTIEDLNSEDVTIACLTGTGSEHITMAEFPKAKILSMVSPGAVALLEDVRAGRADACHLDSIMVNAYLEEFDDIKAVPADAFETGGIGATEIAWGIRQGEDDLKSCLNDFIAQMIADGYVDEVMAKYSTTEYLKPQD
jgi:polar amino acid transport system substrate-binding protein